MFARTGSDFFDFVQSQLTIGRNDFNAPALAVDIGATASRRVDVLFGFEYSRATINSEYRHFVDNDRLPITQRTRMQQMNLSASAKIALIPRGREVGRLAWIPRPVAPYVGAGAGFLRYTFDQSGDFVDFVDLSVFGATLRSSGWTPSTHVFAGADIKLRRRLFLTARSAVSLGKGRVGAGLYRVRPHRSERRQGDSRSKFSVLIRPLVFTKAASMTRRGNSNEYEVCWQRWRLRL